MLLAKNLIYYFYLLLNKRIEKIRSKRYNLVHKGLQTRSPFGFAWHGGTLKPELNLLQIGVIKDSETLLIQTVHSLPP